MSIFFIRVLTCTKVVKNTEFMDKVCWEPEAVTWLPSVSEDR